MRFTENDAISEKKNIELYIKQVHMHYNMIIQ